MQTKQLNRAFTLIELMLTIAVMSAFVTVGIAAYQQKMQNTKIEQAALQIQTWLQAGLAYRVNDPNGKWPGFDELIIKGYIKNFSNPWCQADINHPDLCFNTAVNPSNDNFIVSMKLPDKVPNAQGIATLIANRLPNANPPKLVGTNIEIMAEVPLPTFTQQLKEQVIIKNIQYVTNSDFNKQVATIKDATCPDGREWKRFTSLVDFGVNRKGVYWPPFNIWSVSTKEKTDDQGNSAISPDLVYSDGVHILKEANSYKGRIMVIDACMPKNEEDKSTKINNATTYNSYRY